MDLPVSRIAQGNFKQTAVGFDIVDCVFNQRLVSLDNRRVIPGDYVVLAKDNGDNRTYVFSLSSDYEFETLNRRALFKGIENKLKEAGLTMMELGILLEREDNVYTVQNRVIRVLRDIDNRCGFVMLPRNYQYTVPNIPLSSIWESRGRKVRAK